jgi:hypothetical protein
MGIWRDLTPGTRRTVILAATALAITVVICAAVTGQFDELLKAVMEWV